MIPGPSGYKRIMLMRYPTKFDWWLVLSLMLVPISAIVTCIVINDPSVWLGSAVVVVFLAALCFPCNYTLDATELIIRAGFMKMRVPYTDITRVEPTRNPISSPAFSLDRLAIYYRGKMVMISPVRKDEFVTELRARARLTRVDTSDAYARA